MRRGIVVALAAAALVGCMRERATVPVPTPPRATPAPVAADPRARFADAVMRVQRGDDAGALPIFVDLLRTYPELEDYHLVHLAGIDERAGRTAEAATSLDDLLQRQPESVWVPEGLARRARLGVELGEPDADSFVTRALTAAGGTDRTRAVALLVRADLRAPIAPGEALVLYRRVRASGGPSASAAVARERSDALLAAHPELLDAQTLLDEGTQLLREGRLEDAATRLDAAARATPDHEDRATALRALARARQRQGRLADAIAAYTAAADVEPPPAVVARYDLATLLWNRDRDAEAAALFARIVREAPHGAKADDAHYALGRIAEHAGRSAEAAAEYRRVIATGGDAALVREARWRIAWQAYDDGRLDDAIAGFAAVTAANGSDRAAGRYWEARARERRHGSGAGADLYRAVLADAPESYYADLVERHLTETPPPPDPPQTIAGPPPESLVAHAYHWTRSQELRAAALDGAAARELAALANESIASDAEAYLLEAYRQVDANGRALRLATRLGSAERLSRATLSAYLYPRAYWPLVSNAADQERLDPYLVLALMRQESLFDPDAVSPAAAYGLMQLILPTAAQVAGAPVAAAELTDPARNVALGTHYLRQLLDRYDGNLAKALAAYNGGEDAVAKWEARAPGSPDDEFVERISFRETRGYVKSVLGNYRHYRRLYGAPGERRAAGAA